MADTGFSIPSSVTTAQVCRKSGKLASPGVCENDPRGSAVYTEYFAKGSEPTEVCDHHGVTTVCAASGGLPTQYCPAELRTSRIFMITPEGETGATADSAYRIPGYCTVHTQAAVILPTEPEVTQPEETIAPSTSAPRSPLDMVVVPVGPGYE